MFGHVIPVYYYKPGETVPRFETVGEGLLGTVVRVGSRQEVPNDRIHTRQTRFSCEVEPAE